MNKEIIAVFLLPVLLAACSNLPPVAPAAAPAATVPAPPTTPPVAPTPPTSTAAPTPPAPPIPATGAVSAAASKAGNTAVPVKPSAPKSAPTPPMRAAPIPAAPAPQPPAPPTLNLTSLEQRLRDTRAIGVFTKLSLKNQVDDLLDKFRSFYRGKVTLTFTDLRQRYDLLMLKVISLLQDSDRALASDIVASREAIWGILRDPEKFSTI